MQNIICILPFVMTFTLAAKTAHAAGFGALARGHISFTDHEITIRRACSIEHREIRISDPGVRVTDARWYGGKLLVQLVHLSGRVEQRVYSSFSGYSNR